MIHHWWTMTAGNYCWRHLEKSNQYMAVITGHYIDVASYTFNPMKVGD
jgi:hypothetical protein